MAIKSVTVTFNGTQDSIAATWTGVGQQQSIGVSATPTDGFGVIRPWLTNRSYTGAMVNVPARWSGTVTLTVYDSGAVAQPSPLQTARASGVALGTSSNPLSGSTRVVAYPLYVPSDVTSAIVRVRNRTWNSNVTGFVGNFAAYASDGTGLPTGAALGVWNSQTVPSDGSALVLPSFPVTRGTDGKVVILAGLPGTATVAAQSSVQYGSYNVGASTVSPAPGSWTTNTGTTCDVHLEYTTAKRRIVVLTDSIGVGYSVGAAVGLEATAFYKLGVNNDWAVTIEGVVQLGSIQSFSQYLTNPNLWDNAVLPGAVQGADVVILVGTNDISYSNLATMQSSLTTLISHINSVRGIPGGNIYAATIPPQAAYGDTNGARVAFNTWLLANYVSLGIKAVRDRNAKQNVGGLADNTTGTTLFSTYNTGDGTHITVAGNNQEVTGWGAIL